MMNRLLTLLILFALSVTACSPAPAPEDDNGQEPAPDPAVAKAAVEALVAQAFEEIWSDLDTSALERLHTDDFLLLEQGEVWTNDSIANYQKNEKLRMDEYGYQRLNRFDFLQTEVSGNSVWTAYQNYGTWVTGGDTTGQAQWLESAVAVKTEDGWKLQMLHSTWVQRN